MGLLWGSWGHFIWVILQQGPLGGRRRGACDITRPEGPRRGPWGSWNPPPGAPLESLGTLRVSRGSWQQPSPYIDPLSELLVIADSLNTLSLQLQQRSYGRKIKNRPPKNRKSSKHVKQSIFLRRKRQKIRRIRNSSKLIGNSSPCVFKTHRKLIGLFFKKPVNTYGF